MDNLSENKLQRALYFFLILQLGNILTIFYEFYYLELEINQVILLRSMGVITDILETYLFIYMGLNINLDISQKLKKIKIKKKAIMYGIKLALIAPNIYIIKFILSNYIVVPIINKFNIATIEIINDEKVLKAYITTTILAFVFGTIYYHLENKIFYLKSRL